MRNEEGATLCYRSACSSPLCFPPCYLPEDLRHISLAPWTSVTRVSLRKSTTARPSCARMGHRGSESPEACVSISILPVTRAGKRGKDYILRAYHAACRALDTRCHYLILSLQEVYGVDILTPFQVKKPRLPALSDLLVNHGVMN